MLPGLIAEQVCDDNVDETVLAQMAATMDKALKEYPGYTNAMTGYQHSTSLHGITRTITTVLRIPPFRTKGAHNSAKYSYNVIKIARLFYFIMIYLIKTH